MESQPGKGSTITSIGAVVDASIGRVGGAAVEASNAAAKHPDSVVSSVGISGVAGRRTRLKLSAHVDAVGPARQQDPEGGSPGDGGEGLNGRHPGQRGDDRGGAPRSARTSPQPLGSQGEDASCDAVAGDLPRHHGHGGGEDEAGPFPTRGRGGAGGARGGGGVNGIGKKSASGPVGACKQDCDTVTHACDKDGGVDANNGRDDGDGSPHIVASQLSVVEILTQTQQQQQCDDDGGGVATSRRNICALASPINSSLGCSSIKACIVCGADLSSMPVSQQEVHINACLDGTAASTDTTAGSGGGGSSSRLGKGTEADAGDMANCVVCGKVLAGMPPEGMQAHLNACLDQGASRSGGGSKGGWGSEKDGVDRAACRGNDAAKLSSSGCEQGDMQVCAGKGAGGQGDEEMGAVECGICGMDMSKMGTSWRIKHVNECCDASSQAKRVSGIGSQALAECSICGRDMSGWDADYRCEHVNDCCDMEARKKQARENARDFRREAQGKGVAGMKRGLEEGERSEVGMLLARCGIERHAMLLEQAGITTIQALRGLDEEGLRTLGLPVGARKRIAAALLAPAPAPPLAPRPAHVAPPPPAPCPVLTRVADAKKPRRRAGKAARQDGEGDEQQQQLLLATGEGGGREALKLALALSASLKDGGGESLLGGSSAVARRLWQKERDAAARRVVQGSASGDEALREIFPSQGSPAERPPKLPVSRFLGKTRGKRLWSKGASRPPHDVESTLGFYTAILDVGQKGVAEGACLRRLAEGGDDSGLGGVEVGRGRVEGGGEGAARGVEGAGEVAVESGVCTEVKMMQEERRNPALSGQAEKEEEEMKGEGDERVQEKDKEEEEEEEEEIVPDSEDEAALAMSGGGSGGDRGLLSQLVDIFDQEDDQDDEDDEDADNVDNIEERVGGPEEGGVGVGGGEDQGGLNCETVAQMERDVDDVNGVAGMSDGVMLEAGADVGSEMEEDGDVDIVEAGSGYDEGDDIVRELQEILEGIPEGERAAARGRASHAACLLVEKFSSELAGADAAEEEELAQVRERWVRRREEMKKEQAERLRHAVLAALVPESSQ